MRKRVFSTNQDISGMGKILDRKADKIEETHGRKLTNRQREFAKHYVDGTHSNAACARLAGYAESAARIRAHGSSGSA
jgi:hypothetical protein